jgi:hypothetical protein
MLTKLREPFGKAGLIVAIVALIAALGGGAYAASGGLTGKQKKEVTKIAQTEAKKFAGKPGTPGTPGTAGTPGTKGDAGAAGSNGSNGTNGTAGESVEVTQIATGEPGCGGRGGVELGVEGSAEPPSEICNGQPWNPAGLPQGATETGVWAFNASEASAVENTGRVLVPISFPIPLRAPIVGEANVHFVGELGDSTCTGTVRNPKAPVGMICVYWQEFENAAFVGVRELEAAENNAVDPAGGYLVFNEAKDHASGRGSWAVTGG